MDGKKARWRIMMGWKYKWMDGGREQRMDKGTKNGKKEKGREGEKRKEQMDEVLGGGRGERSCKLRQKQGKEGRPGKVRPGLSLMRTCHAVFTLGPC